MKRDSYQFFFIYKWLILDFRFDTRKSVIFLMDGLLVFSINSKRICQILGKSGKSALKNTRKKKIKVEAWREQWKIMNVVT